MTLDLIGKHIAIEDYPEHLVEGGTAAGITTQFTVASKFRCAWESLPIWIRLFLTPVRVISS